jgi:N-acetylglucosaminyldiphosphoundecaprenol N-acetyl-beta-D-mannosaminyltransferase
MPGLRIAGTYAPPFGPIEDEWLSELVSAIDRSDASIVWVAMGTPKQDWVSDHLARRTSRLVVGVGAAFDFAAGNRAEAPQILQMLALEWLFRLLTEPKRLWRRYLFGNIRFLWAVAKHASCRRDQL